MSDFEYKVIAAPSVAKKVKGAKTIADRFAHGLAATFNAEAAEGWEYVSHERFQVEGKAGLLSKSKASEETFLVFRRAKGAKTAVSLDQRLETMVEKRARNKPEEKPVFEKPKEDPIDAIMPVPAPSAASPKQERAEPRMQADEGEKPARSASIFSPLSSRDADDDDKHAPKIGPAGRD